MSVSVLLFVPADYVRFAAAIFALAAIASFPAAAWKQGRPCSAWVAVAGCEILLLGSVSGTLAHVGAESMKWYRTPVTLLGGILLCTYNALVLCGRIRRRG